MEARFRTPAGLLRVIHPVAFPEFFGETWGFDEAVAEPRPDTDSIVVGSCGPGPETPLVLEPNDRVARGWILDRSLERDLTIDRSEVEVALVTEEAEPELLAELDASADDEKAGRLVDMKDVIARLGSTP